MWDFDKYKNKVAVISDKGQVISYGELNNRIRKIKACICDRALVAIVCTNTVPCLVFYLSCIENGMVPLMIPESVLQEHLKKYIDEYRPHYCYIPNGKEVGILDSYECVMQDQGYVLLKRKQRTEYVIHESLALLLLTSGSTGGAKAVRQSYKNIQSNANSIVQYLNLKQTERAVIYMPLCYTYRLSIIHSHLLVGASILLTEYNVLQKEFWKFFARHKATSFSGVPYTYELLRKIRFDRMHLPYLRYMTQAGGRLKECEWEYIEKYSKTHSVLFYSMYGQTEATARISYLPWQKMNKRGSVGIAVPETIVTIDEYGEIIVKGNHVCLGYAENYKDLCMGDEWHGVLHTGDIGKYDKDGYLYITGRNNRYIKMFGKRINLDEVEHQLTLHLKREVFVSAETEKILIISVEKLGHQLVDWCAKTFHLPQRAFEIIKREKIPRKSNGKVDYGKL